MRNCESYTIQDDLTDSDLTQDIPVDRDTYTAGEISTILKVPRLRVVQAMRELGVRYVARHNSVPSLNATGAISVIKYLRRLLEQDAQRESVLASLRKGSN